MAHEHASKAGFQEHVAKKTESSHGEKGYPWTRLGYTYDWGAPGAEVGEDELVLRPGAEVEVVTAPTTEEYCK